jgi:hypothetical protein
MSNEEQKQQEELLKQLTAEHRERLERIMQMISSMPEDVRKPIVADSTFNDLIKLMIIKELFRDPTKEYLALRKALGGDGSLDPKSLRRLVRKEVIKLGLASPLQQAKAIKQQIKELKDTLNELKDAAGFLNQEDIDKLLDKKLEKLKEDLLSGNVNFKEAVKERLNYRARLLELLLRVVDKIADRAMDAFGDRFVDSIIGNLFKSEDNVSGDVLVGGNLGQGRGVNELHGGEVLPQGHAKAPQQVPGAFTVAPPPILEKGTDVGNRGVGQEGNNLKRTGKRVPPKPPRISLGGAGVPLAGVVGGGRAKGTKHESGSGGIEVVDPGTGNGGGRIGNAEPGDSGGAGRGTDGEAGAAEGGGAPGGSKPDTSP